jgi:transposase
MAVHQSAITRLITIPGVDVITAWTLIAELGIDMSQFPDADHPASWAGLVPGSYESAGKRKSTRTRHGNRWIRRALCQSAWAVSHKKDCYLTAHSYRWASRHGQKKALVATAHELLIIAFHILRDSAEYHERGGSFFDRLNPQRTATRLICRLATSALKLQRDALSQPLSRIHLLFLTRRSRNQTGPGMMPEWASNY